MYDFTLTQTYALIALNAQDSLNFATAKKAALRCVAAASILESQLSNPLFATASDDSICLDHIQTDYSLYMEAAIAPLAKLGSQPLSRYVKAAAALPAKHLKKLEKTVAESLIGANALEEIPNLMGCDFFYCSASVTLKEYRTAPQVYTAVTESLRADILEDGTPADETLCLLWLLKESGCLPDVFSQSEIALVAEKMSTLYHSNPLAKKLFGIEIRHSAELTVKALLKGKKAFVKTPVGTGINYTFPILERSQSVFIDTEAYFSGSTARLNDVIARLTAHGHAYTILRTGDVPLLKIDNIIYEAVPDSIGGKMPVHGVRLRKYPI